MAVGKSRPRRDEPVPETPPQDRMARQLKQLQEEVERLTADNQNLRETVASWVAKSEQQTKATKQQKKAQKQQQKASTHGAVTAPAEGGAAADHAAAADPAEGAEGGDAQRKPSADRDCQVLCATDLSVDELCKQLALHAELADGDKCVILSSMGPRKGSTLHRHFVAMPSPAARSAVFKAAPDMKKMDIPIYVDNVLTRRQLANRRQRFPVLRELRDHGIAAYWRFDAVVYRIDGDVHLYAGTDADHKQLPKKVRAALKKAEKASCTVEAQQHAHQQDDHHEPQQQTTGQQQQQRKAAAKKQTSK